MLRTENLRKIFKPEAYKDFKTLVKRVHSTHKPETFRSDAVKEGFIVHRQARAVSCKCKLDRIIIFITDYAPPEKIRDLKVV
jgi:hypothetical protein